MIANFLSSAFKRFDFYSFFTLGSLLYAGSPQSKEGDERMEAKLDYILKNIDPENQQKIIKDLERKFPKK